MVQLSKIVEYELDHKLTQKQWLWIDEYIKTNSYTTATINAGYNTKQPKDLGYQNSLRLKKFIDKRRKELNEKITNNNIATIEEIQAFWTEMYKDASTKDTDRLKASELLAKSKGGFIEHVEVKKVETDWFVEDDTNNG